MENENLERMSHVIYETGEVGHVIMDDDIIAVIAGLSVRDIPGVAKLTDLAAMDKSKKVNARSFGKGVAVRLEDGVVGVDLCLNVLYGYNIPDVAAAVQNKVSQSIENMLGLPVSTVNVSVADIQMA